LVPLKHSAHERLFLHVIDESFGGTEMKQDLNLASSLMLSEPINLTTSTMMFSKRPADKDNFFAGESMVRKTSEKEDILQMGADDNNLISSPREVKSPR
jgi:hypothetical protein